MKRCPECRRDYYDDSLFYCLDDGSALLEGPASADEPATAILHQTASPGESETRPQIHTTGQAAIIASGDHSRLKDGAAFDRRLLLVPVLLAILAIGGYFGYGYLGNPKPAQISSIAVLPFENRSGNADSEYLSDGLAESLIYRLSQIPELKVSSRSAVFRYKGKDADTETVGNELEVDAVMTGRLVQRGDNLTISVDLVDVRNKKTLWGEQFERKMSDLLTTQRDIASNIVDKLQLKLSGSNSKDVTKQFTSNNEAYQLYLQGRYFWNKRTSGNLKKATELLKAATEKDPNFALAYAGLADCYAVSYYYVGERPREILPLAKTYAARAIELDPTLAEPHTTLAFASWLLDWDRATAEKEFLRAIELNPNYPTAHHWYSRYLRGVGRYDEAYKEITKASELEPLSLIFLNNIAEMQIDRAELDAAASTSQRVIDLDASFWPGHQTLAIVFVKQGRLAEALTESQKSVEVSNRANAPLALLAYVQARMGKQADATVIAKELEQRQADGHADGRDLAIVYVGLNDHDKAFEWLEKAFQRRSLFMAFLNLEPLFEPLRADPRWADLKRRVGLPA